MVDFHRPSHICGRQWALPAIKPHTVVLCSQWTTGTYTVHRIDQDGHWQQFGAQPILLVLPSSPTGPVMHQCSFTGLVKNCLGKHTWLSIAT